MNASHETPRHPESCSCDACEEDRYETRIIARAIRYLEWRASTYPKDSVEARTILASAAALKRGAWRGPLPTLAAVEILEMER